MVWLCLILGGTVLAAGNSIVDKKILHGQAMPPFACATSFGVVGLPVALLGLLILPLPSRAEVLLGISAGVLFIPAAWLYYDTLACEDVSRIVPLLRLSSLQTLLLGMLFLGEMLSAKQWIAFFFLLGSSLLLGWKRHNSGMTFSWTTLRILPATTLLALSGILMADLYRTTSVWTGITWESVGMILSIIVLSLCRTRGIRTLWRSASLKGWGVLIGDQTVRLIVQVTTALAIAHGVPVALSSTLSSVNLLWVWLFAFLLLQEKTGKDDLILKCCGMFGMTLGIFLLL
jgi:drug/metabolite transporter (DMT)-like permease